MSFYVILGIERGATLADVKRAYKRLARKYHPDINPGDRLAAAQFRQIAEAYETLSDPDRRRRYDTTGSSEQPSSVESAYGFDGFDFSVNGGGASAPTFGDLFADVFNQRQAPHGDGSSERGIDLHQTITVTFEEAVHGGQRPLTVTRQEHCRTCRGSGRLDTAEMRCSHCHGSGVVKSARGHMVFSKPCEICAGSGRLRQARCPTCGGQQVEVLTEPFTINVPPGLADGARLRVPGKGHAGRDGGENGDLYVTIHVQPHPLFRREGDEVHLVIPVAVHEAALGAKIDVPSLEGIARLRIPPGTQSGQRFRLRERGVWSARERRRGDLVIEVRLVLPKMLDERSKELLREFGRINHDDVRSELR
ncbi:MAG TPA: J domain-containing protein [Vicinamibacterales bacterium]|jgi:molecular chaperone DnaJ|nr:J domain-containing protein [Vicinamibacterales bacterium]